jgi:hypothetical protein
MKTNILFRVLIIILLAFVVNAAFSQTTYPLITQPGTIQKQYVIGTYEIWNIDLGVSKPVVFAYEIDLNSWFDGVYIYSCDANGNPQSLVESLTGACSGLISTNLPTGRARVIVEIDPNRRSVGGGVGSYAGLTINFGYADIGNQFIDDDLYIGNDALIYNKLTVKGRSVFDDNVAVGTKNTDSKSLYINSINKNQYNLHSYISKNNSTASTYGIYSEASNSSGNVYGLYSKVSGVANKKWAGYFQGGDVEINGGNLVVSGNLTVHGALNNFGANKNTIMGQESMLKNTTGMENSVIGYKALFSNTTGSENSAFGFESLYLNVSGNYNTAVGRRSLQHNKSGHGNTATGHSALRSINEGYENNAFGYKAGESLTTGIRNNIMGQYNSLLTGSSYNIVIGYRTNSLGNNNIVIGKKITLPQGVSNAMNIGGVLFGTGFQSELPDNPTANPVNGKIGINVVNPSATLDVAGTGHFSGKVGIGTTEPDELLTVNGTIHAKKVRIDLDSPLADYVFAPDYNLMSLTEIENFVRENKHLPNIPSATEVQEKGMDMGEFQNLLLQKIEELTLHAIEQQKIAVELQKTIEKQNVEIEKLKKGIK